MNAPDPNRQEEIYEALQSVRRRVRGLTVAVVLLVLMVVLLTASVYGYLINFMAGDAALFGGSTIGAALLGFAFGWFARWKA